MRRELPGGHDRLCLFLRIDVWDDYPLSADVQRAVNDARDVEVDPDDRGHAPEIGGTSQVRDVLEIDRPMLPFYPDRLESERTQPVNDVRRHMPGQRDRDLSRVEPRLHPVLSHGHQPDTPIFAWQHPGFTAARIRGHYRFDGERGQLRGCGNLGRCDV